MTDINPVSLNTTADEAVVLIKTLGAAASAINPAWAGAAALVEGIATVMEKELLPMVESWHQQQIDVATQAVVAAKEAASRARAGVAPASIS